MGTLFFILWVQKVLRIDLTPHNSDGLKTNHLRGCWSAFVSSSAARTGSLAEEGVLLRTNEDDTIFQGPISPREELFFLLPWGGPGLSQLHLPFVISVQSFSLGNQPGKKWYVVSKETMPFSQVKALCAQLQASVASPKNDDENRAIQNVANDVAYLGITDEKTEGQFMYVTGGSITYSNWNNNEPNDSGSKEDCTVILTEGKWNDVPCSNSYKAVCEFPAWRDAFSLLSSLSLQKKIWCLFYLH